MKLLYLPKIEHFDTVAVLKRKIAVISIVLNKYLILLDYYIVNQHLNTVTACCRGPPILSPFYISAELGSGTIKTCCKIFDNIQLKKVDFLFKLIHWKNVISRPLKH